MELQTSPGPAEQPAQEVSIAQRLSRWYRSLVVSCLPKAGPLSSVAAGEGAVAVVVPAAAVAADAVVVPADAVVVPADAVVVPEAAGVPVVPEAAVPAVVPEAAVAPDAPLISLVEDPEEDDLTLSTQSSEQTTHE